MSRSLILVFTVLTMIVADAQVAAAPLSDRTKHSTHRKRKAARTKPAPLLCPFEHAGGCQLAVGAPQRIQWNADPAHSQGDKSKIIFDGPPERSPQFENDVPPPKKTSVGGRVGVEFSF